MWRVLFVGVASAALAAGSAIAADVTPLEAPAPAPAPVPSRMPTQAPYDWTGFFFGVNGDYGQAKSDSNAVNTATGALDASSSLSRSSFHRPGQVRFASLLPPPVTLPFLATPPTASP